MTGIFARSVVVVSVVCTSALAQNEVPAAPGANGPLIPQVGGRERDRFDGPVAVEVEKAWNQSDLVVVAVITDVVNGPVAQSMPPIWSNKLSLKIDKVFRGELDDKTLNVNHSYRNEANYNHRIGEKYLLALSNSRGSGWTVMRIAEADEALVKEVETACSLPVGWHVEDKKIVSPWASMGKEAWDATLTNNDKPAIVCAITNRPALMAGSKVQFSVEAVPPAKEIKWTNPDGDGEYTITVSNPTKEPIPVPALLMQDGKILWNDSLAIVCQDKSYPVPTSQGVKGDVSAAVLKPGESVSTTINALSLQGPEWPRGGYRIEFTFALGEKSKTMSFYYMSRHHDGLRNTAQKASK